MWTHCTFCTRDLGRNGVVETFPVGRRLAFDAARGRLWVICARCGGWNLTPLEERWEAVEDCERLFRLVRTRLTTGELGLARLSGGLELVRIGRPLRAEFAAWRYGYQLERRHRRAMVGGAVAGGAVGALVLGGGLLGGLVGGPVISGTAAYVAQRWWQGTLTGVSVPNADGQLKVVRGARILDACLVRPEKGASGESDWSLWVPFKEGWELVTGPDAARITARFMRRMNRSGGRRQRVREALNLIRLEGQPRDFIRALLREQAIGPGRPERVPVNAVSGREVKHQSSGNWLGTRKAFAGSIGLLDAQKRLAFEMAFNEEHERRAMEGDLRVLEDAWREAEEIAAIADGLLEPEGGRAFIDRHSRGRGEQEPI